MIFERRHADAACFRRYFAILLPLTMPPMRRAITIRLPAFCTPCRYCYALASGAATFAADVFRRDAAAMLMLVSPFYASAAAPLLRAAR
jgi:hypothetical protein